MHNCHADEHHRQRGVEAAHGWFGSRPGSGVDDRIGDALHPYLPKGRSYLMSPNVLYRLVARAEAVTWTMLIIALILKYMVKVGDWPVSIAGFIHGFVFLTYAVMAVLIGMNQRWSKALIFGAAATAVVPFLTIPYHTRLERQGKLSGSWRTEATDHPGDRKWTDATMRWLVARPVTTTILLFAVVIGIFSCMLVMGPPGGSR